jgi:P27 family predicted phage terminase small subunit
MKAIEERRGQPLNEMPATARAAARRGVTVIAGPGAPPMPQGLTKRMQTAWRAIVRDLTAARMLDRADWPVVEALAVAIGRAREARAIINEQGLLHENSQGKVAHPALGVEERAWREVRQLAGSILPMSPPSRASLGGTSTEDAGDDMERELGPARLQVVGDA